LSDDGTAVVSNDGSAGIPARRHWRCGVLAHAIKLKDGNAQKVF
jgi:hypothetical protein